MPKFEEPLEVQEAPPDRLYCFLSQHRPCDGSCVAFRVGAKGRDRCAVLRDVSVLVKLASRTFDVYANRDADVRRASNAPYVNVDPITGRPL